MTRKYIKSTKDYFARLYLDIENPNIDTDRIEIVFRSSDIASGIIALGADMSVSFPNSVKIQGQYLGYICSLLTELQKTWLIARLTGGVPRDFIEVSDIEVSETVKNTEVLVPDTIYLQSDGDMIMRLNEINGRDNVVITSYRDLESLITCSESEDSIVLDESVFFKIGKNICLQTCIEYPVVIDTVKVFPSNIKNYLVGAKKQGLEEYLQDTVNS